MAHDPSFDSAWLKWTQAVRHAQTLETDIETVREHAGADPVRAVRAQYDAKRHGFGVLVQDLRPIPTRWSLLLGDIANNFRSSLDHLAWQIVKRGSKPPGILTPGQEKAVYFPVHPTKTTFNAQLPSQLPGARKTDITKVRRPQPYRYSEPGRLRHPLVLLTAINKDDKHRTIQPVWLQPLGVNIKITDQRDCIVPRLGWKRSPNPLEINAELAYIPARKLGPNPQLDVEIHTTSEPSIGNRVAVNEWSIRTAHLISRLLVRFSDPPEEIFHVGADIPRLVAAEQALR